jgi:hypothetical protein
VRQITLSSPDEDGQSGIAGMPQNSVMMLEVNDGDSPQVTYSTKHVSTLKAHAKHNQTM